MLLLDRAPADIWRMLLPRKNILFPSEGEYDDLIFYYRNDVFFVHEDGAVIKMKKPDHVQKLSQEDLWELLFHEKDTVDYDDQGIFSIGAVLMDMGFVVPLKSKHYHESYLVEIVNTADPENLILRYEMNNVSFQYALYHSLLRCHALNEECDGEFEHEVQQIVRVDDVKGQISLRP